MGRGPRLHRTLRPKISGLRVKARDMPMNSHGRSSIGFARPCDVYFSAKVQQPAGLFISAITPSWELEGEYFHSFGPKMRIADFLSGMR